MDQMRKSFTLEWDAGQQRHVRRVWWRNPMTGKEIPFPAPVVSRYKWKPEFAQLCKRHKIESHENGRVAERSCKETLRLLLGRNLDLANPEVGRSAARPLRPVSTWDAVSWQHKKVTHGGWKFADYKPGVSTQSEWKVVTAGVGKCDDHWAGQTLLIPRFAKEFNEVARDGVFNMPGVGELHVSPDLCTDMAFTREAGGQRMSAATHCVGCDGDTEKRRNALHEPPVVRGDETDEEIDKILNKCELMTWRTKYMLGHVVPWDFDWSKGGWSCKFCKKLVYRNQAEEQKELQRLDKLREEAQVDKEKAKELEKELKQHALLHNHHVKGRGCRFHVDSLKDLLDIMHGDALNICKTAFKYSFLDNMTDEQREELAALSVEGGWAADFRKPAKKGGERNSQEKWMRASQVNIFFDGKSRTSDADEEG